MLGAGITAEKERYTCIYIRILVYICIRIFMTRHQNAGQKHNLNKANNPLKCRNFKYLGTKLTKHNYTYK